MEWILVIRNTLNFIENNLTNVLEIDEISKQVGVSSFYLQKGFSIATNYSISEYIKSRRLSLAAVEVKNTKNSIIDIAYKYGYETPESFAKAFIRFHGATPSKMRNQNIPYRQFDPLIIDLVIKGGNKMDYKITRMLSLKVIGFEREFTFEEGYKKIPKFWDEISSKHMSSVCAGNPPRNAQEKAIVDNSIGEFGACIDDIGNGKFRYLIAGKYRGGAVPEGMVIYEFPDAEWAIFNCVGPMPTALQDLNTKIFKEWLPNNPEFELDGNANIEWYDVMSNGKNDPNYHSGIWIPIKRKK